MCPSVDRTPKHTAARDVSLFFFEWIRKVRVDVDVRFRRKPCRVGYAKPLHMDVLINHQQPIPGPSCRGVLAGLPHTTYRLPDRAPHSVGSWYIYIYVYNQIHTPGLPIEEVEEPW